MPESLRPPPRERVRADVTTALAEDIGDGDVTARLIRPDTKLQTRVIAREAAVLCGRPWFDEVFAQLDERIEAKWAANDGTGLEAGQEVCQLSGPARPLLSGERAALNFLQALSGCATNTRTWCDAIEGTGARILDTRKTLPGLRHAQKYAVRCGGAVNHRMGLYDAFLIKENHIAAAGGISGAVARAREQRPELLVEVEVETLAQLDEAVQAGAQ
ncbi:MAG: carboxylating nicotinate-nucleotide diphosphorylase, partial [Xanthomonadales bacterium]|nr:carboxylating nicotinate-nucleotide diphosphorylase [Xanthomonadales bacterium]